MGKERVSGGDGEGGDGDTRGEKEEGNVILPYLTWLLREWWGEEDERASSLRQKIAEGREEKKCEEEIKRVFEDKKREVVKWLMGEGMGKFEAEKLVLY